MVTTDSQALFGTLLRLGDSALVLGQRLSALCGHAPAVEEDIAQTNVALDLIGQARLWLSYAAEVERAGRDEDELAFLRDAHDFRNLVLTEQPNGDYAETMARQLYYDAWHFLVLRELTHSADARIAEIAAKSLKEARYHVERSSDWVVRLGDGTEESHRRMQAAVERLWGFTGEMFVVDEAGQALAESGVAADVARLAQPWWAYVSEVLEEATLDMPEGHWRRAGGKPGQHTEHLGYLLAEMQHLQRAYPGATW